MARESGSRGAMPASVPDCAGRALGHNPAYGPDAGPAAVWPQSGRDHATEA
jgi:hypothetical protein